MTTYKELAEHLEAYFKNAHRMDEVIAILCSLDAQRPTVDEVMELVDSFGICVYQEGLDDGTGKSANPIYGVEAEAKIRTAIEALAAPVAAVRKAMARLADLLDEDKFMEIEGIFTSAGFTPPVAAQASKPLSDAEIFDLAEPFGAFEFGDAQGDKRLAFAHAAITAFCLKNGIKERG